MKGKFLFVLWFCVLLAGSSHHNSDRELDDSSEIEENKEKCSKYTNSDSDPGSSHCESSCQAGEMSPLTVVVKNGIDGIPTQTYKTQIACKGILLGAMKRLLYCDKHFNFTYTEDPNYGPFLASVNGVAGNAADHTFWELLVPNKITGEIMRTDVGIGCYIPDPNEKITLNFTKW